MCVCVCPMSYGQAQYLIRCLLHSRAKSTPASRSRSSWESPLHTSSVLVSSAKAWDSNIKNHLPSKPRTPFQQNLLVQTTSKTTYAKTVHRPGHFRGDCQVDQMKPVGHYNGNVKTRNPYPRVWSATMDYEVCSGLEGRSMRSIFTKEGVQMWPTQGSITVHTTFLTHPTRCQLQSTLYVLLVPFQTKQHSSEPTTDLGASAMAGAETLEILWASCVGSASCGDAFFSFFSFFSFLSFLLGLLVSVASSGVDPCADPGLVAVFSCWASFAFASRTACNEDLLSSFVFAASLVGLVVFISPVAFFISLSSFSRFCARFSSSLTAFSKAILFFSNSAKLGHGMVVAFFARIRAASLGVIKI